MEDSRWRYTRNEKRLFLFRPEGASRCPFLDNPDCNGVPSLGTTDCSSSPRQRCCSFDWKSQRTKELDTLIATENQTLCLQVSETEIQETVTEKREEEEEGDREGDVWLEKYRPDGLLESRSDLRFPLMSRDYLRVDGDSTAFCKEQIPILGKNIFVISWITKTATTGNKPEVKTGEKCRRKFEYSVRWCLTENPAISIKVIVNCTVKN